MADTGSGTSPLVTVNQLGVQALNALVLAVKAIFPQGTGTSTSATGGASITLPSHPVGYLSVTLPDGTPVKIPYYDV